MTNEEKVQEICDKMGFQNQPYLKATYREEVEQAIEEGMQWKDEQHEQEKQQWIDKTTKWLEEQDFGGWIESETEDLINDFKQSVREGQL